MDGDGDMDDTESGRGRRRRSSILDVVGVDLLSVISPVSICMLIVVFLISSLSISSSESSSPSPITAANLVYQESATDSTVQKLSGSVLNALVFVASIAAVTFLLLILYYYNFTRFLKNYTRFSAFFVLSSMGGSILLSLLRSFSIPLDSLTSLILLFNFSLIGVISVFSTSLPILLKQSYMLALAVIVAAWFSKLPEWTTWTLLLALSIYDLLAVLCPGGPLRLLVEMASQRDEDLPALVYEARPTTSTTNNGRSVVPHSNPAVAAPLATMTTPAVEMQPVNSNHTTISIREIIQPEEEEEEEMSPLVPPTNSNPNPSVSNADRDDDSGDSETSEMETTRGIRLGLGDFVFYSVLVGRAAMYDLMTVYACYLVIISGLGCTLILLTVWRRALPALPISITLGVAFYFLTRLLMEPFVVGASTSLVMF